MRNPRLRELQNICLRNTVEMVGPDSNQAAQLQSLWSSPPCHMHSVKWIERNYPSTQNTVGKIMVLNALMGYYGVKACVCV